jgi:hypothetical protein
VSVIQHKVHVLVEPNDTPLYSQIRLVHEPDLDGLPALQVPEDQVDGPAVGRILNPMISTLFSSNGLQSDQRIAAWTTLTGS